MSKKSNNNSANLTSKFKDQFKSTDDEIKPFTDLKIGHIYEVLKAKSISTKYGDKYIIYIRDIDKQATVIRVFAPNSYVNKCKSRKINIENKHFFMYNGTEEKKRKDTNEKYGFHKVEIIKKLEGYEGEEIDIESDEEEEEEDINE